MKERKTEGLKLVPEWSYVDINALLRLATWSSGCIDKVFERLQASYPLQQVIYISTYRQSGELASQPHDVENSRLTLRS